MIAQSLAGPGFFFFAHSSLIDAFVIREALSANAGDAVNLLRSLT